MEEEWFNKLTEAQKTKLRSMDGKAEDLIAFCKEEKLDLPDDLMEAVSGGEGYGGDVACFAFTGCSDKVCEYSPENYHYGRI